MGKYREAKKISKDIYHHFYLASKGNQFKNKTVLVESIHKMKAEKKREKELAEQREARRVKAAEKKEKRNHRKAVQLGIVEVYQRPLNDHRANLIIQNECSFSLKQES